MFICIATSSFVVNSDIFLKPLPFDYKSTTCRLCYYCNNCCLQSHSCCSLHRQHNLLSKQGRHPVRLAEFVIAV